MLHSELFAFDDEMKQSCGGLLCGVDEAGRGPLAGPVCCAAVILREDAVIDGLNDSKKLSEKRREQLIGGIIESSLAVSVRFVSNEIIDEINILQATMQGMRDAVRGLSILPSAALVDGNRAPAGLPCRAVTVVHGDAKSACIAAASVVAKVTRDRFMRWLDGRCPAYGFKRHKGYGTAQHYAAIAAHGVTPYHRMTFLKGIDLK